MAESAGFGYYIARPRPEERFPLDGLTVDPGVTDHGPMLSIQGGDIEGGGYLEPGEAIRLASYLINWATEVTGEPVVLEQKIDHSTTIGMSS